MLIGYARVSTDEQHLQLPPYRGIRFLLGLIAASLPLPHELMAVAFIPANVVAL
jgi:hypothetical protein